MAAEEVDQYQHPTTFQAVWVLTVVDMVAFTSSEVAQQAPEAVVGVVLAADQG
jgi:hypothetical protein